MEKRWYEPTGTESEKTLERVYSDLWDAYQKKDSTPYEDEFLLKLINQLDDFFER